MSTHVMVDLETLGTGNDAHILSIGAVKFDKTGILNKFHTGVELDSCKEAGREITASTVAWWLDLTCTTPAAWLAWKKLDKAPLWNALDGFSQWCATKVEFGELGFKKSGVPVQPEPPALWGNGASFDNVILRSAFDACGLKFPVPFHLDRCYRTLKAMAPEIKLERTGIHHSAVDDAESQALHLIRICKDLEVGL